MFGIGFSEILIVLLVIVVFVRPADLPRFLRAAGRLYARAKRAYGDVAAAKDLLLSEIDEAAAPDASPSKPPPADSPPDKNTAP